MATSGSWNYLVTGTNVMLAAAENLGVIAAGGTLATADAASMLQRLNLLAKQWQGRADMAQGMKVWTRQRVTLLFDKGHQTYLIGPASTDDRASTLVGRTTLSANEASGQTTLSITSNVDSTSYPGSSITMAASDIVAIEVNSGDLQFRTISGTPGATMDINSNITTAADAGNKVYWFTARAQRMPVVEAVYLRDENMVDTPIRVYRDVSEYELGVLDKFADGLPTAVLVEPGTLNTRLTFNMQPTDMTYTAVIVGLYPAEDYDSASNDIAFPQEWYAALEWELTRRCAPMFGAAWTKEMDLNWQSATAIARQLNPETTSSHFEPGRE